MCRYDSIMQLEILKKFHMQGYVVHYLDKYAFVRSDTLSLEWVKVGANYWENPSTRWETTQRTRNNLDDVCDIGIWTLDLIAYLPQAWRPQGVEMAKMLPRTERLRRNRRVDKQGERQTHKAGYKTVCWSKTLHHVWQWYLVNYALLTGMKIHWKLSNVQSNNTSQRSSQCSSAGDMICTTMTHLCSS